MEVEQPRHERADDEPVGLKRLMHRRRLMQAADDRLEIVNRKGPGIVIAVPADHVQRMMIEHHFGQHVGLLDDQAEFARLVVRRQASSGRRMSRSQ